MKWQKNSDDRRQKNHMSHNLLINTTNETFKERLSHFDFRAKEPLSQHTSFQIGGPVDFWVEPRSYEELAELLKISREYGQPLYLIGGGNNMLVEDEGLRGIAVHLTHPVFRHMESLEGNRIRTGAGTDLSQLLAWTAEKGSSGLEFLAGVPGTVGGAVWMNAGRGIKTVTRCPLPVTRDPLPVTRDPLPVTRKTDVNHESRVTSHESRIKHHHMGEVVESVTLMEESGKIKNIHKNEIEFSYR
jgi:UDP-N-acetylenolpyruvoylglucosamine reductase